MVKIIVDVDTGVDDAWALLVFLSSNLDNFELLGITCTIGNTSIDYVCRNTLYILEIAKRSEVPVYRGAEKSFLQLESNLPPDYQSYFGKNGFSDVELPRKSLSALQEENAVVALNRMVEESKGEITLVCLAPLTTIALTTRTYPNFAKNVKEIYVMGGNYTALGNVTMCAEFNFHVDPEAAHVVLTSFEKKLTLLPWETCFNMKVPFEWRLNVLGGSKDEVTEIMNLIEKPVIDKSQRLGYKFWISCDSLLATIIENPQIVLKKFDSHAIVELGGHHTRGQIVIDHLKTREHNITIIESVNQELFQNRLLAMKEYFDINKFIFSE